MDKDGILRVKCKFDRWSDHKKYLHPILLAKDSPLTVLIIRDLHCKKGHAGIYSTLTEFRRRFYVQCHFSVVKRVIKTCITCRKVNARPIKVSQNSYRECRVEPSNVPYRSLFVDHFGPCYVKVAGVKRKVWVLVLTCMWSRAINLKLCMDLSTSEFLKAFQTHVYEFGAPQIVYSDQGSSILAGANTIKSLLNSPQVTSYLRENGMRCMSFEQYPKGNHELGGMVESCVKLSKRIIRGSIGNSVLDVFEFLFVLSQAVCIANKRPISFREALRDDGTFGDLPAPITPECLLRGHDLVTLNFLPGQGVDLDAEWSPESNSRMHIKSSFECLNANRQKMLEIYNEEFLADLTRQATNVPQRYKPIDHALVEVGDIILLKEECTKVTNFPMARVIKVTTNSRGEVTEVTARKGNREEVRRHVKSVILLLKNKNTDTDPSLDSNAPECQNGHSNLADLKCSSSRPKRKAASKFKEKLKSLIQEGDL